MIKAIIFDLDDTLLNDKKSIKEAFRATCQIIEREFAIDSIHLEEKVRECARNLYISYPIYPFTQKIGINPLEGLWGTFNDKGEDFQYLHKIAPTYQQTAWKYGLEAFGISDENLATELAKAFRTNRKKHPFVFDDTFKVLEKLKGDYQLLMLTNGSPSLQRTKLALTPELEPYFKEIVVSGEYGVGKPDLSIFHHLLDLVGLTKDQVVMVGDNLKTDILGANRIGMKSIWINRNHQKPNEVLPTYQLGQLSDIIPLLPNI